MEGIVKRKKVYSKSYLRNPYILLLSPLIVSSNPYHRHDVTSFGVARVTLTVISFQICPFFTLGIFQSGACEIQGFIQLELKIFQRF